MSDKDIPASGSRWEPADGAPPASTEPVAGAPAPQPMEPAEPVADHGAVRAGDLRPARLPRRLRGRTAVAAAGVGLVLAGGVGGFAIGHAVAGNAVSDGRTVTDADLHGGTGGRPDVDPDGDHQGPGGRFPGAGPDATAPDGTSPDSDDGGTA